MNNKIERELRSFMNLPYTVMLRKDEEGDVIARIKELDGCIADGQDEIEAIGNLENMKELWFTAALKAARQIPLPEADEELPSGKWLTRVPRSLHKKLIELADVEGVSLNQLVAVGLAEMVGRKSRGGVRNLSSAEQSEAYGSSFRSSALRIVYSSDKPVPVAVASQPGLLEELTAMWDKQDDGRRKAVGY